jgi:hypothetical protein
MHGYAKESMDDFFCLFKEYIYVFKWSILGGMFTTNWHLLILDDHGNHVTLKTIEQTHEFGLDMIILLAHTSHAL